MITKEYCTLVECSWGLWKKLYRRPDFYSWPFYTTEEFRLPGELGRIGDTVFICKEELR